MKRIVIPSLGPSQWRSLLADPLKHWKRGRSALEVAISWERAQDPRNKRGLPREIAAAIDTAEPVQGAELLFAIPEQCAVIQNKSKNGLSQQGMSPLK